MLTVEETALVLVDYQSRLAQVMHGKEDLHEQMKRLVQGARILQVPILWVEQYPQGLGETDPDIQALLAEDYRPIAKMEFGACRLNEVQSLIEEYDRKQYLVAGIEAHVCVYQTVKQLVKLGKQVEFVQDCISSRTLENKQIAVEKMKGLGALPTSVEMALFELMGTAKHPCFKEISALIK